MQVRLQSRYRSGSFLNLFDRFSNNSVYLELDPRERGEGFRTASEALLSLRDISPVTIQACVLLGAYAAAHGDTDIENVYYSTAGRMCLVLDLPNRPVASLLEREVNIRGTFISYLLFWAPYQLRASAWHGAECNKVVHSW